MLTGLLMRFLGWLGGNVQGYYVLAAAALTGAGALCAGLLAEEAAPAKVIRRWCLAPSFLLLLVYNWDAFAVLCAIVGLLCLKRRQALAAGIALGLGFCFKLYPGLYLLPALAAWRKEARLCARLLLGFAVTAVALNLPFALINYDGWSFCFRFNFAANRLPNPDTIWSVLRFIFSWPQGAAAGKASTALFLLLLGWTLWRGRGRSAVSQCYAATLALLLSAKFFSPQYALWLLPFFALEDAPRLWSYGFELANLGALFAVLQYLLAGQAKTWYEACAFFVVARHACLAALLIAALGRSYGSRPGSGT
ncbi:MAG: DUF2029 domain-containing protein [Elusimicrobia bacterium]|nr:DUF2029 domain-containing protein [Elusimicrobiota bacterium]